MLVDIQRLAWWAHCRQLARLMELPQESCKRNVSCQSVSCHSISPSSPARPSGIFQEYTILNVFEAFRFIPAFYHTYHAQTSWSMPSINVRPIGTRTVWEEPRSPSRILIPTENVVMTGVTFACYNAWSPATPVNIEYTECREGQAIPRLAAIRCIEAEHRSLGTWSDHKRCDV